MSGKEDLPIQGPRGCTSAWKFFVLPSAFALLFLGGLFLLDFPKPGLDDLFFVGTGLNLAQGGDYSNPLLERQQFPSHFYFVHPPTYSYGLASWLKLLGVSTFSMLGFQLLMYLVICTATVAILHREKAPLTLAWLVPLGVTAAFLPEGLRPESFSVALTMTGFALIHWGGPRPFVIFSGFFLMILGGSSAERLTFFSAALMVAAIFDLRRRGFTVVRSLIFAGCAGLIVCAMLMYLIGFKPGEFWKTFRYTAAGRTGGGITSSVIGLVRSFSIIQWPLVLLWLAVLPLAVQLRHKRIAYVNLLLTGSVALTGLLSGSGHGVIWYLILMLFLASVNGEEPFTRKLTRYLPLVIAGVLLIANIRNFIYVGGMVGGKIRPEKGDRLTEAQSLRATPQHPVLVDSETARYVFNYCIPKGFFDWSFSARFPGSLATDDPLRPEDIYLIGPNSVDWLNVRTHLNLQVPIWKPFGPNKTFHEVPRWVYIIRPQECGEVKQPQ